MPGVDASTIMPRLIMRSRPRAGRLRYRSTIRSTTRMREPAARKDRADVHPPAPFTGPARAVVDVATSVSNSGGAAQLSVSPGA